MERELKIISSWDDACPENYRLAKLLKAYGIPAIFFINNGSYGALEQAKLLSKAGFEIGAHTYSHPSDLKLLNDLDLSHEIIDCRKELQEITGQEINWFCYPRGRYNEHVKYFVKEAGYKYARTTKIGYAFKEGEAKQNALEIKTGFHCFNRPEYHGTPWLEYALNFLEKNKEAKKIHFWGHAWEINRHDDWERLEKLFEHIKNNFLK